MPEITEDIREKVRQWAGEGCGLSEIQARLKSECATTMTYMDVRFLVLDLGVDVREQRASAPAAPERASESAEDADDLPAETGLPEPDPLPGESAGVSVDISPVAQPGSLISGSVRFGDGVTANWSLDQFGRLALAPPRDRPDYRPSESDIRAFQVELRRLMETRGF